MLSAGIVILNYNTGNVVKKFVEAIKDYDSLKHIIIVDNCSNDDSVETLSKICGGKTELIKADTNGGYARGNNLGLRRLGEYGVDIAFVSNPDVEVGEDAVTEILRVFEEKREYGVLSCIHLDTKEGFSERQCWKIPSLKNEFLDCFFLTRPIVKKYDVKEFKGVQPPVIDVEAIPGSFYGVRMELLRAMDFFDEGTFLYYEENILAFRIRSMGFKSGIISYRSYIHRHENSSTVDLRRSLNAYKILIASKRYYQDKYLKTKGFTRLALKICYKYALIEKYVIYKLKYK